MSDAITTESAIKFLANRSAKQGSTADEALKFSQAAVNLATACRAMAQFAQSRESGMYWLISYSFQESYFETTHIGSPSEWREEKFQYKDGPYVLLNAQALSSDEYEALDGVIG